MSEKISMSVVRRLPRYYRFLDELDKAGTVRISSRELAERMCVTASQIRQDLNCFGGFGQQGYGYNVAMLRDEIGYILGLQNRFKCIIVGAGNLGRAIALHMNFEQRGMALAGIFDCKEAYAGQLVAGLPIRHISGLEDFCNAEKPDIAVLCVPRHAADELADSLSRLGVRGVWNFSHSDLSARHPELAIENVHLGDSLMTLSYKVNDLHRQKQTDPGKK